MRKLLLATTLALAPMFMAQTASAVPIATDGSWVQTDEFMAPGSFFSGSWDFNCVDGGCVLDVSDWAVISDLFEVFDNALSIGLTSVVPSWSALGCVSSFDPACFTTDADTAWSDSRYSKGTFVLGAGLHSITIQNLFIPPQDSGNSFPDSTVQLRVSQVPVPAAFGLLAAGLAGLGAFGRRRKSAV